jgi:hypothetical protein
LGTGVRLILLGLSCKAYYFSDTQAVGIPPDGGISFDQLSVTSREAAPLKPSEQSPLFKCYRNFAVLSRGLRECMAKGYNLNYGTSQDESINKLRES